MGDFQKRLLDAVVVHLLFTLGVLGGCEQAGTLSNEC